MAVTFAAATDNIPERVRIWMGGAELWFAPNALSNAMEVQSEYAYLSLGALNIGRVKREGPITTTEASFSNGLSHLMGAVDWDTGVVNASFVYGPYGEIVDSMGAEQDDHLRRFNGKESDELSKLSYYGFRYYDSQSLSWTQADPLYLIAPGIAYDEPRRMSLYAFSLSNPVRYVDPDGKDAADVFMMARGIDARQVGAASNDELNLVIQKMNLPTKAFSSARVSNVLKTDNALGVFNGHSDKAIEIDPFVFDTRQPPGFFNVREAKLFTIVHEVIHAERELAGSGLADEAEEILVQRLTISLANTVGASEEAVALLQVGLADYLTELSLDGKDVTALNTSAMQEASRIAKEIEKRKKALGKSGASADAADCSLGEVGCMRSNSQAFEASATGPREY